MLQYACLGGERVDLVSFTGKVYTPQSAGASNGRGDSAACSMLSLFVHVEHTLDYCAYGT